MVTEKEMNIVAQTISCRFCGENGAHTTVGVSERAILERAVSVQFCVPIFQ